MPVEQVSGLHQEFSILSTYGCADGELTVVLKSYVRYALFARSQDLLTE